MRKYLALVGGLLATTLALGLAAHKEQVLANGTMVLLALAPTDPRSLIQGDYMRLRYAAALQVEKALGAVIGDGELVISKAEDGTGTYVRVHQGEALAAGEMVMRYRNRGGGLRIGAESFFFQEGEVETFAKAKFGELRVTASGESVLVGLRDVDRGVLGKSSGRWLGRLVELVGGGERATGCKGSRNGFGGCRVGELDGARAPTAERRRISKWKISATLVANRVEDRGCCGSFDDP